MLIYIVRRLLQGLIVIVLVSFVTFGILQFAPGSPIDVMMGDTQLTQTQLDALEHKWGLDRPWYEQYFTWAGNMLRGDFGVSIVRTGQPVSDMLRDAAPVTLKLNAISFAISLLVAIPVGVAAAVKRNSLFDYSSMVGATLGVALPSFWISLMLIIIFALKLGWLPSSGSGSWKNYVMPVMVLATEQTALLARVARGSTLEVLRQDYVTTARAKGLANRVVISRHVFRNAMLPIVTLIGLRLAFLLSGTLIVETIFAWPGIGRLFIDSVFRLDYQVVQAIVLLLAVLVVVMNLLTDLLYAIIDPRIRLR
jgi:ABC-type dipeptide/oligopeptide/nickel transport system permease component